MHAAITCVLTLSASLQAQAQLCDPHWDPLGGGTNGPIKALVRLPNGDLIAGGRFTSAGNVSVNNVARWNGITWQPLGAGLATDVIELRVRPNGNILAYSGFASQSPSTSIVNLAEWDGVAWVSKNFTVGGGYYTQSVTNLFVLADDSIIVFGKFWEVDQFPIRNIARLANGTWTQLGLNADTVSARPSKLIQNGDGTMVAWGNFTTSPRYSDLLTVQYDGQTWSPRHIFLTGWNVDAHLVTESGAEYLAGAMIQIANQVGAIAKMTGGQSDLSLLAATPQGGRNVTTLTDLGDGMLFVAGSFADLAGTQLNNIAVLDHDVFRPLGNGTNGPVARSLQLQTGQVVIAGSFTSVGDQMCGNIATAWPLLDVEITRQPQDQAVAAGSTVTFSLIANQRGLCPAPLSFQWQRRDPRIADSDAPNAWINLVDDGNFVNTTQATFSILTPIASVASGFRCRISGCSCENAVFSDTVNFSIACPADFNADGGVDFQDVEAFFIRWENGC